MRNKLKLSTKRSTLPAECKIAKWKYLFKKIVRTDPKNYRPISLFPLVSEVIKKSIHLQIDDCPNGKLIYM